MNLIKVSIIIPCYNHGAYILDAINSIQAINAKYEYEVIIVNDGSTDQDTIDVLSQLEKEDYKVYNQQNQGLAATRNNAIRIAKGAYIIPLDSDNRLHENYLNKAVEILENDTTIDIVYGNPMLFGDETGVRKIGQVVFAKLVFGNYIDACTVYRKKVWDELGGYDGNMPAMGNEDWEFWVHAYLHGHKFFYLDDVCYDYRILSQSMTATTTRPGYDFNKQYIYEKYYQRIIPYLVEESLKNLRALEYIKTNKLKTAVKFALGIDIDV